MYNIVKMIVQNEQFRKLCHELVSRKKCMRIYE